MWKLVDVKKNHCPNTCSCNSTNPLTLVWLALHFPLCSSGCNCNTVDMDCLWIYRYEQACVILHLYCNYILCGAIIFIGREKKEKEARVLGLGPMPPCCPCSILWVRISQQKPLEIF